MVLCQNRAEVVASVICFQKIYDMYSCIVESMVQWCKQANDKERQGFSHSEWTVEDLDE